MTSDPPAPGRLRRVLGEPLLHFVILGGLVFGVWRGAQGTEDAAHIIVIDRATQDRLYEDLQAKLGRPLTDEDRQAAIDRWVDGELLYREGLAMGLDRDDPVVRQRVVKKMEFVSTNLELPAEPDEDTLRRFMREHPERYAGPPRFDFELISVVRTPEDTDDRRARALLEALRGGADPKAVEGRRASGKRFTAEDLGRTYGVELQAAVTGLPPGEWGMVPFPRGWTLVHLLAQTPGDAPPLDKVRNRLQLDWKQSQRGEMLRRRLDELRAEYRVELRP